MKQDLKYDVSLPLRWPDGWERTLIKDRKNQTAWKKTFRGYQEVLIKELLRMDVTDCLITHNPSPSDRMDPGVAVYFSKKAKDDYTWQTALEIESSAPTLEQIDTAFKNKAMHHHPDRVAMTGGDVKVYYQMDEYRKQAKAWVLGTYTKEHEYVIPCDRFTETRWNLAAIRLAFAAFRQLDRVGIPTMLERTFRGFKTLTAKATEVPIAQQPVA